MKIRSIVSKKSLAIVLMGLLSGAQMKALAPMIFNRLVIPACQRIVIPACKRFVVPVCKRLAVPAGISGATLLAENQYGLINQFKVKKNEIVDMYTTQSHNLKNFISTQSNNLKNFANNYVDGCKKGLSDYKNGTFIFVENGRLMRLDD